MLNEWRILLYYFQYFLLRLFCGRVFYKVNKLLISVNVKGTEEETEVSTLVNGYLASIISHRVTSVASFGRTGFVRLYIGVIPIDAPPGNFFLI